MKIKSTLRIIAGFFLLIMGAIGLFLPVWPTTPFVIGSAACFAKSPRLMAILLRIKFFREYIENYQTGNGLSKKTVISSLVFLWGMLLVSCLLTSKSWVIPMLIFIGIAVSIHILWISRKTS